jgi:class 3 adenylate cyclase
MEEHPGQPASPVERDVSTRAAAGAVAARSRELQRFTLHFADDGLEAAFRRYLFASVISSVRVAHILGIAAWALWGLILSQYASGGPQVDAFVWYGTVIPILIVGLIVLALPTAQRVWESEVVAVNVLAALVWAILVTATDGVPFELGFVGVIFILAFTFTLNRLRFLPMTGAGVAMTVVYLGVVLVVGRAEGRQLMLAFLSLTSFLALGMIASYTLERSTRLLFLRERQLDHERRRSEALLLNVLPQAIAVRLMERADVGASGPGPDVSAAVADGYTEVAVLFADLAGFTEQAGRTTPEALVAALNDIFSDMDLLADKHGLEKIKTVGDAYMAVAGVPTDVVDPAVRAVDMALDLVSGLEGRRWPSGDRVDVRVGVAVGPAVAGVIGRHKFAYDVWGDTVNLASRLQSAAPPGGILVADAVAERTGARFVFGPLEHRDLKGKGKQGVRIVVGRADLVPGQRPARRSGR